MAKACLDESPEAGQAVRLRRRAQRQVTAAVAGVLFRKPGTQRKRMRSGRLSATTCNATMHRVFSEAPRAATAP